MPRVVVYFLCAIATASAAPGRARAQVPVGDAEGSTSPAPPLVDPAPTEPGHALDIPDPLGPREDRGGDVPAEDPARQGGPVTPATVSDVAQPPPTATLQLVGGRVSVRSGSGEERGVGLGCEGTTGIALDGEVYVLCPPRRVVRVRLAEDESTSVRSGAARVDLVGLQVVDGMLHAVARQGGIRPLAAVTRDDRGVSPFADLAAAGIGAPSTAGRLSTAFDLAERGQDALALRAFELAAIAPACPPHWWDHHAASFAVRTLDGLRAPGDPHSNRGVVFGVGVGALVLAGVGLAGGVVASFAAFRGFAVGGGSGGGGSEFGIAFLTTVGTLLVLGIALMIGSSVSPSTEGGFRERQQAVARRMRPPRGTQPGQLFPAFGHSTCATSAR